MEEKEVGPPRSFPINSLQELRDRSYFNSANFEFNKSSVPLQKPGGTSREKRPRLLACHDFKGGYLDDQWIQGSQNGNAYTLTHWRLLDIVVYFSHKLVTLPPPSWTNAAHRHGVQVLGTFITEWDEGASVCKELLASKASSRMYADRLAELAEALGFDGWLINIENVIARAQVANLQEFVRYLTVRMHSLLPGSSVIWYDSVTTEGKLAWQNWLNVLNKPFFDVCDGIFTNYTWKSDYPMLSASAAGNRAYDVYMGVDVFGRGSFGGGQFQCDVALTAARKAGVSAALFAPGWASETNQDESRWWDSIENCWPAARPDPVQLPFFTDFDIGRGIAKCLDAKQVSDLPWNNLSCQNLQPLLHVGATDSGVQFAVTSSQEYAVYSGGVCIKAVGDVGHDEVCIVQLYHTETIIDEPSLNVSYSVSAQNADSNFSLALRAQDSKGSKVIYFLLDSKDDRDTNSFPRNHHFSHISAVFEHVNEGHNSTTTGASSSSSSGGGDSERNKFFKLDSTVSGGKWTVREFILEWGNYKLIDIFGIYSAAKDLRPILIKLLHENETLFDGETYATQVRSTELQSHYGDGGSGMPPVETSTSSKDTNLGYCLRLGHIRIASTSHEHSTSADPEFMGYHPSWLVGEGGNRFVSVNLRWELLRTTIGSGTWPSCAHHLFVTVGRSDEDGSSPTLTYLGMTMLSSFYVYMLPLPKSSSSVTFSLLMQCTCGMVQPISNGTYTLQVPTHESGYYVRTQPSLSDWLFRELQ